MAVAETNQQNIEASWTDTSIIYEGTLFVLIKSSDLK